MPETLAELVPQPHDAEMAREALVRMRPVLDDSSRDPDNPIAITLDDGSGTIDVPKSVLDLLVRVLGSVAAGEGVTVVPAHAELTTQQAADLLNVSRPFLVKLLENGSIGYRTVGTHRRVQASSLMQYMRRDDDARRAASDDLAALTREMELA
jgi:excisionase family DNA binding protein